VKSPSSFGIELSFFSAILASMSMNPARRTRNVWGVIMALAILGIFAPFLFGMDGFSGGFAIAMICSFIALTGLIVVIMYQSRAKTLDDILSGDELLAHWTYSREEWNNYSELDFRKDTQAKWSLYRLVMVITAAVCLAFSLIFQDSWVVMIGVFLGIGLLLAVTILLTTRLRHRQNRRFLGEAYVSRKGIYLNHQLHIWRGLGGKLESSGYNEQEKLLEVTYSLPDRTGRSEFTVRVPVPPGESSRARTIAAELIGAYRTA
jgi:hypothetical protein